jgi:hypothetical protein
MSRRSRAAEASARHPANPDEAAAGANDLAVNNKTNDRKIGDNSGSSDINVMAAVTAFHSSSSNSVLQRQWSWCC